MKNKKLIAQLNDVLSELSASTSIYKSVVHYSKKDYFKLFFSRCLENRRQYMKDIKTGIIKAKGRVKTQRATRHAIGSVWTAIKVTISSNPELTMLEDINRRDVGLLELYQGVLALPSLSPLLKNLLEQHVMDIKSDTRKTEVLNWVYAGS